MSPAGTVCRAKERVDFTLKVLLLAEAGRHVETMELGVGVLAILDASFDLLGDCGLGVVQDDSHL